MDICVLIYLIMLVLLLCLFRNDTTIQIHLVPHLSKIDFGPNCISINWFNICDECSQIQLLDFHWVLYSFCRLYNCRTQTSFSLLKPPNFHKHYWKNCSETESPAQKWVDFHLFILTNMCKNVLRENIWVKSLVSDPEMLHVRHRGNVTSFKQPRMISWFKTQMWRLGTTFPGSRASCLSPLVRHWTNYPRAKVQSSYLPSRRLDKQSGKDRRGSAPQHRQAFLHL